MPTLSRQHKKHSATSTSMMKKLFFPRSYIKLYKIVFFHLNLLICEHKLPTAIYTYANRYSLYAHILILRFKGDSTNAMHAGTALEESLGGGCRQENAD